MNRFDYVEYDPETAAQQAAHKAAFSSLCESVEALPDGRAKSLALTKLEEAYMWIGKALRDQQIQRNGAAPLNESRKPKSTLNQEIWAAYSMAYKARWSAEPVRNGRINGQIANFGKRLGAEAPEVAAYYLSHNDAFYVKNMHSVGLMLKDAEKLRTEWFTGQRVTGQKAREVERMQTNSDNWDQAAQMLNERGAREAKRR